MVYVGLPTALAELGGSRFFSICLMLSIFIMSLDVCVLNIECLVTAIYDDWYNLNCANPKKVRREWFVLGVVVFTWISGFPYYLNTGLIWLDVMDYYLFTFVGQILIML